MISKHILVDVQLQQHMPDDDVRYHAQKIRKAIEEYAPDAVVRVTAGRVWGGFPFEPWQEAA